MHVPRKPRSAMQAHPQALDEPQRLTWEDKEVFSLNQSRRLEPSLGCVPAPRIGILQASRKKEQTN